MDDALNLLLIKGLSLGKGNNDRGCGLALLIFEKAFFRQGQMDPGRLNRGQGGDGSGKFSLQGPGEIDFLDIIGQGETLFVENLKTYPASGRQAVGGKFKAGLIEFVRRYPDVFAAIFQIVGNAVGFSAS